MIHTNDVVAPEREKYQEIWAEPDYHTFSPGMENVERFISVLKPNHDDTLIDIGCGSGDAGVAFQEKGLRVSWVDLTGDALNPAIPRTQFVQGALWQPSWTLKRMLGWDYGFCCDVMEHIPLEYTMLTLHNIISACRTTWFQIAFEPDVFGTLIGKPLHLSVMPFTWWRDRIAAFGMLVEARDLCGCGVFVVKRRTTYEIPTVESGH